jgi:acyl-CoA synthetase (NDP forming)
VDPLAAFFAPRSVAVVGASRDPGKVGGSALANLRSGGFGGRIIAVNAHAETVQGMAAVLSILSIDEPVDLAVIAVPASQVLSTLKECLASSGRVVSTSSCSPIRPRAWRPSPSPRPSRCSASSG